MCKCSNCQSVKEGRSFPQWPASLAIIDHARQRFYIVDATPDFRHQASSVSHVSALSFSDLANHPLC